MARAPWPGPPSDGVTIWHLSDTHLDDGTGDHPATLYRWAGRHMDVAGQDVERYASGWNIDGRLHTGDITDDGAEEPWQDTAALAWLNTYMGSASDMWVVGNHDLIGAAGRGAGNFRSTQDWEAVYGRSANTSTYLGDPGQQVRVLTMGPTGFQGADATGGKDVWKMSAATLSWLDTELAADTSTPTFLACHYTLRQQDGSASGTKAQPQAALEALIAGHPHVTGWLAGHSHWPNDYAPAVSTMSIAGRAAFPGISAPSTALYKPGRRDYPSAIRSLMITYRDADRIEVRFRDHGAQLWVPGAGGRVTVLTPS